MDVSPSTDVHNSDNAAIRSRLLSLGPVGVHLPVLRHRPELLLAVLALPKDSPLLFRGLGVY